MSVQNSYVELVERSNEQSCCGRMSFMNPMLYPPDIGGFPGYNYGGANNLTLFITEEGSNFCVKDANIELFYIGMFVNTGS